MEKEIFSNTDIMVRLKNIENRIVNIEDLLSEIISNQNNDTGLINLRCLDIGHSIDKHLREIKEVLNER